MKKFILFPLLFVVMILGFSSCEKEEFGYDVAKEILGEDFISPEEIMSISSFNFVYTEQQLLEFRNTIPSKEVLRWCARNNYMLVAGPSQKMTILDIRNLKGEYFYLEESGWYDYNNFARNDRVFPLWYMIRKKPVPQSTSKNWDEQISLISEAERVPNISEFVWALIIYKEVRNIYLFDDIYVRTLSLDTDGSRVYVGFFDQKGMLINELWNKDRKNILGVSSLRK